MVSQEQPSEAAANRFGQPRERRPQEALALRARRVVDGERDRHPFRHVVHGDGDGERDAERWLRERRNECGEALGEVVQCDCERGHQRSRRHARPIHARPVAPLALSGQHARERVQRRAPVPIRASPLVRALAGRAAGAVVKWTSARRVIVHNDAHLPHRRGPRHRRRGRALAREAGRRIEGLVRVRRADEVGDVVDDELEDRRDRHAHKKADRRDRERGPVRVPLRD
mmetsp:Transcript_12931/g.40631  ORF Transcript_12931/g.40631 Transcript_12931/m.40631 type:complete len:228 (-) Transcript_12931:253-936(-)